MQAKGAIRRRAVWLFAAAVLCGLWPAFAGGAAQAASALAVGTTTDPADGLAYGWANNYKSVEEARTVAMQKCRAFDSARKAAAQCKLVESGEKLCIAIAFDPKSDSAGMGWATAADRQTAEKQALEKCRAAAPADRKPFCRTDTLKCDAQK